MHSFTPLIAGFMGLGATELIIILVIILLLFGGAKLPSLAKGLGTAIKEFKTASKEDPIKEDPPVKPAAEKKVEPGKPASPHGSN